MIPTLTSVSRQAILAGELPREFVEHIGTTSAEEKQWQKFWRRQGIADGDISYAKTLGHDVYAIPELQGRVAAVVVNAVDEILHGAEVLGDRQVAAGIDLWARAGFLKKLVDAATRAGYETWITSDHGNLPTLASSVPRQGQTVEQAGTRVRVARFRCVAILPPLFGRMWTILQLTCVWSNGKPSESAAEGGICGISRGKLTIKVGYER